MLRFTKEDRKWLVTDAFKPATRSDYHQLAAHRMMPLTFRTRKEARNFKGLIKEQHTRRHFPNFWSYADRIEVVKATVFWKETK